MSNSAHWIAHSIVKPGALRATLHIAKGKTIPATKLAKAAKMPGKTGQRARLAETFRSFKH